MSAPVRRFLLNIQGRVTRRRGQLDERELSGLTVGLIDETVHQFQNHGDATLDSRLSCQRHARDSWFR